MNKTISLFLIAAFSLLLSCKSYKLPTEAGPDAKLDTLLYFALVDSIDLSDAFDSGTNVIYADLQMNDSAFYVGALFSNKYIFDRQGKLLLEEANNFSSYFGKEIPYKVPVKPFLQSDRLTIAHDKQLISLGFSGKLISKQGLYKNTYSKGKYYTISYSSRPLKNEMLITMLQCSTKKYRQYQLLLSNPYKNISKRKLLVMPRTPTKDVKNDELPYTESPIVGYCDGRYNALAYTTIHSPVWVIKSDTSIIYRNIRALDYDYLPTESLKTNPPLNWTAFSGLYADFKNNVFALSYYPARNGRSIEWLESRILFYNANTHTFFEQTVPPLCMVFPYIQDKKMYLFKLSYPQKLYVWELRSR